MSYLSTTAFINSSTRASYFSVLSLLWFSPMYKESSSIVYEVKQNYYICKITKQQGGVIGIGFGISMPPYGKEEKRGTKREEKE